MGGQISKLFGHDIIKEYSAVEVNENNKFYKTIKENKELTPWERVHLIIERDAYGDYHPAFIRIKDVVLLSCLVGGFVGGINRAVWAYKQHFLSTNHEYFETPRHAQKALQDKVFVGFGQGFFKLSWRLTAFTFMYMATAAVIAQLRQKSGILDQVGGAATAGFLYKFQQGPKASIAGIVAGAGLGFIAGSTQTILSRLTGQSTQDIVDWQHRRVEIQRAMGYDKYKVYRSKLENQDLAHFHEHFIADDDMSYSSVKGTPISNLKEGLKLNLFPASEIAILPPVAVKKEFDERMAELETARKELRALDKLGGAAETNTDTKNKEEIKPSAIQSVVDDTQTNTSVVKSSPPTSSTSSESELLPQIKMNAEITAETSSSDEEEKPKERPHIVDRRIYTTAQPQNPFRYFKNPRANQ